jgi:NitT/TauT family transport system substrate-binding protein
MKTAMPQDRLPASLDSDAQGSSTGNGRRSFMKQLAMLAGASSLYGVRAPCALADAPLETMKLRIVISPALCFAPQYIADALLRAEGFSDIQYIKATERPAQPMVAEGEGDFTIDAVRSVLVNVDAGGGLVALSGVHLGCYELFGSPRVRKVRDLKGRKVATYAMGSDEQIFLAGMAAYVGLDPNRDIKWIVQPAADSIRDLAQGEIDAYLAFPPTPQKLRANKIGQVIVNTATDRPWSQYFCCMLIGNRDFVNKNPVASKRALRAILKATDLCAREPEKAARLVVESGYASDYETMLQILREISYSAWRTYDPEDTMRFFAVQLHEVGMIKSSPQKVIAKASDWRFLNELKKELKA